jgi:SCY1-like protein 2
MLPVLDYSTVKDEVFPPIASVFSKTSSLLIKVRGLEAFVILCGGSNETVATNDDDLSGIVNDPPPKSSASTAILDKYTVQEKIVPLLKAIKTREPAVMMAALKVFRQVGQVADIEFVALEVLPILWSFSLGPLLNVQQFSGFMDLIKILSSKVEREQTKKLRELASVNGSGSAGAADSATFGRLTKVEGSGDENASSDFERLVLGRSQAPVPVENVWGVWEASSSPRSSQPAPSGANPPKFSWSSDSRTPKTQNGGSNPSLAAAKGGIQSRSITPDMNINSFPALRPAPKPSAAPFSPSQITSSTWGSTGAGVTQNTSQFSNLGSPLSPTSQSQTTNAFSAFSIPPPPSSSRPPGSGAAASNSPSAFGQANLQLRPAPAMPPYQTQSNPQQKQGLDKYESLL